MSALQLIYMAMTWNSVNLGLTETNDVLILYFLIGEVPYLTVLKNLERKKKLKKMQTEVRKKYLTLIFTDDLRCVEKQKFE